MIRTLLLAAVLVGISPVFALALTLEWDRNPDSDLVDHYEAYVCQPVNCSPLFGGSRYGGNVPQPASSIAKVTMPMPITPDAGRVSVIAVDALGNRSGESNIVSFRQAPLTAPKSVLVK